MISGSEIMCRKKVNTPWSIYLDFTVIVIVTGKSCWSFGMLQSVTISYELQSVTFADHLVEVDLVGFDQFEAAAGQKAQVRLEAGEVHVGQLDHCLHFVEKWEIY